MESQFIKTGKNDTKILQVLQNELPYISWFNIKFSKVFCSFFVPSVWILVIYFCKLA